jgi:2-keto-4-pentenoate hydratase/2-oxohepta-3-ene-1,7-dioic acid hydratase in catechol pathway
MVSAGIHTGFALGTFSLAGRPPFAGLVMNGDRVIAVEALRDLCRELGQPVVDAPTTLRLFEHWATAQPMLQAAADALANPACAAAHAANEQMAPMTTLKVHPPVAARQIFMSGANYFKHVVDLVVDMGPGKSPGTEGMNPTQLRAYAEEMMTRRRLEGSPYVFSKPASVLSGAFDAIVIPSFAKQPDWDLELAVVIGAPARHVKKADAMRYVAGYTIANDITNRDWVWAKGDMKALGTDWLSAKSCPTFLPVGPFIVPASQVADPQALQIRLLLNGQTMQDENTNDMIFGVARLIEHISSVVQLLPGDLICTGSPSGNGTHYNRYLQPGDVVEGSITGLGTQRTPVIADTH